MESDILKMSELDTLVQREMVKRGTSSLAMGDSQFSGELSSMISSSSEADAHNGHSSLDLLASIYEQRPDLATCTSNIAHGVQSALYEAQYDSIKSDPAAIAFACELLYQRVMDEPLLHDHFQNVNTNRIQTMVNTAVCKCVYKESLDASFLERLERIHSSLSIRYGVPALCSLPEPCTEADVHTRCISLRVRRSMACWAVTEE